MKKNISLILVVCVLSVNLFAETMSDQCNFKGKESTFKALADHVTKDLHTIDDLVQFSIHNGVIYHPSLQVIRVEMMAKKGIEAEILDKLQLDPKGPQLVFEVNSFHNVAFRFEQGSEVKIIAEFSQDEIKSSQNETEVQALLESKAKEVESYLNKEYGQQVKYSYTIARSVRTVMEGGFENHSVSKSPFKWWVKRPLDLQMKNFTAGQKYFHNGKTVGRNGHSATCEHEDNFNSGMELVPNYSKKSIRQLEVNIDLEGDYMSDYISRFTRYLGGLVWVDKAEKGIEQARQPIGTCTDDKPLPDGRCVLMEYPSTRVVFGVSDRATNDDIENILKVSEIFHNYYQVVSRIFIKSH